MSALIALSMFAAAGLLGLWILMRIGIFLSDRVGHVSPSLGAVGASIWMLRVALLLVSLNAVAFFGFLVWIGARSPSLIGDAMVFCIASVLYALLALVLNFPGFPLHLHRLVIFPVQLLLLPIVGTASGYEGAFLPMIVPFVVFAMLWIWNVHDRATVEEAVAGPVEA